MKNLKDYINEGLTGVVLMNLCWAAAAFWLLHTIKKENEKDNTNLWGDFFDAVKEKGNALKGKFEGLISDSKVANICKKLSEDGDIKQFNGSFNEWKDLLHEKMSDNDQDYMCNITNKECGEELKKVSFLDTIKKIFKK